LAYVTFPLISGVYKDETPLSAKAHFTDSDKCRSVRGKMQVIGGWELASSDTFDGICRGLFSWRDNTSQSYTAIGTHTHLQVLYDGLIYDITPIVSFDVETFNVTTIITETTVTITGWTAHGLVAGQRFTLANATPATVGGVTLAGEWEVLEVLSSSSLTFTATAATSSAGPTAVTTDVDVRLAPGLVDNLGGPGYGVGGYGLGGYGEGADETVFYPRTWSLDNWGQNLIANPRGGGIYEWAPNFSDPELVVNGDFDTDTDWTKGTGWTISAGAARGTAGFSSLLTSQLSLDLEPGAYNLLEFDATVVAGTVTPRIGTTDIGAAVSTTGRYRRAFYTGTGGTLSFFKNDAFGGTLDNVSVTQLLTAQIIPNAPTQNTCVMVTAERILMALGTVEASTSLFNPLHLRWSNQEDNQDWTPAADNQAGDFTLARGGRVVAGLVGRGEYLVWTDKGLYVGRYVPDPNVVYRFDFTGAGCGPMGAHAPVMLAGSAYWLANTGEFFRYTGTAPEPLFAPIRKYVFDNMALSQGEKVYAFANSAFKEVGWVYPDKRDGNECSRYALYSVADNCFSIGTFDRTAWIDSGGAPYPIAADSTGQLYYQEKGKSDNGNALTWSLTTGAVNLSDGNDLMRVLSMIPDFDDFEGGCDVTVMAYRYPNSTPTTTTQSVTATTEKIDFRITGRQVQLKFDGNSAPAFMRTGQITVDARPTGMVR
jgi:hypothetical protein